MNHKTTTDQFLQLKDKCRSEEKIKGSRFIANAAPVATEREAQEFIGEIKKEFHDATHNCYAWKIGVGQKQKYRYNDGGEPSGTAGRPILKSISSTNASNVCVVITRYFGGTKLGTGGLMRAYGRISYGLLKSCETEKKYSTETITFSIDFDFVNVAHSAINSFSAELKDSHYGEKVTFEVEVRASKLSAFKAKIIEATNGQVKIK
jgi:uncharacterized YigZ family protein